MLLPVLLGVLGLVLGSFIATLVLRWPEGRSVVRGRSQCDGCGKDLTPWELVPLVSAAVQRGRCRACGARIAPLHWQVELAAGAVGAAAGLVAARSGTGLEALAGAVFGWLLLCLALLDLRAWWLPDRITALLAVAGFAGGVLGLAPALEDRATGGLVGFAALWLVAVGYKRLRGREGMGCGDPKLLGGIGLWLGWQMLPAVLLVASLVGLGVVLFRRLTGRAMARTDALPFGALLAAAAYPAWLMMVAMTP